MKRFNVFIKIALFCAPLFLFFSCEKEVITEKVSFGGDMERYDVYEPGKTYYAHHEQYAYWEETDTIAVLANTNCDAIGDTVHATPAVTDSPTTSFRDLDLDENAEEYLAVYPHSAFKSWDGEDNLVINFPGKMNYSLERSTTAGDNPHIDSTFAKNSLPFVAWAPKISSGDTKLYFRAVAGITRVQLFSSASEAVTIDSVVFIRYTDYNFNTTAPISGDMQVKEFNVEPYYSYVVLPTSVSGGNDRITLTNVNRSLGGSSTAFTTGTGLLTFYVPLPATGTNNLQRYYLNMKVVGHNGSTVKEFNKKFRVDIHRQNITMMPAIDINEWTTSTGSSNVHIVGSGTKDRPFQIYSGAELVAVRDAYNNGRTINGQVLNENTYYKISRSDIYLKNAPTSKGNGTDADSSSAVWTTGFGTEARPFVGHFYLNSASAVNHHITNNSSAPLFNYIGEDGIVELITVKGNITYNGTEAFSPLCLVNKGTISNCHNRCTVTGTADLAGLCVTNYGVILDGASESPLVATGKSVAGICLNNESTGEIRGFQLSSALPEGSQVAGICHNNKGRVYDCMVTINQTINVTSNWGGIVYTNSGTVEDCMITGPQMVTTSGSIGGICNTLTGGEVLYCWNTVAYITSSNSVAGGVVANCTGGTIKNCWSAATKNISGYTYAGGIAGVLNGSSAKIVNCYNRAAVSVSGTGAQGGIVGNLINGTVENCYNTYGNFFGNKGTTIVLGSNCYNEQLYQTGTVAVPTDHTTMNAELNGYLASHTGESNLYEWLCNSATAYPTLKRPTATKGGRR